MERMNRQQMITGIIGVAATCGTELTPSDAIRELAWNTIRELRVAIADKSDYADDDTVARDRELRGTIWSDAAEEALQAGWYEMSIDAAERAILIMEGNA